MSQRPNLHFGLDVGYGVLKAVCAETRKSITCPSAVVRMGQNIPGTELLEPNFEDQDGKRYLVGQEALKIGDVDRGSMDSTYVDSEEYRILALHALSELKAQGADVVTGLPIEWFLRDRKRLERDIPRWRAKKVRINSAAVVPQPLGSIVDVTMDWDGTELLDIEEKRVAVVDVGHGTIDAMETIDGQVARNRYRGRTEGVHTIHLDLLNYVNSKYKDAAHRRQDMDKYLREGGFYYNGEFVQLAKPIREAKRRLAEKVSTLVKETWPEGTATLFRIIFTGGGAEVLREELLKVFPEKQVIIPQEPALANARGFAKLAAMRQG